MPAHKVIYTTSEISRICKVSLSTVINWVNGGKLHAFETPGGHRRIREEDLSKFLHAYNMPLFQELEHSPRKKILIVEHDAARARLLVKHVQTHLSSSEVRIANDGFGAGSAVVSFRPELVILNISLPGLDGLEVCRRIRTLPGLRDTRIIAVGAGNASDGQHKVFECGADAFLPEPLSPQALNETLSRFLVTGKRSKTRNGRRPSTVEY